MKKTHTDAPWYFVTEDVPQHNAAPYQIYKVGYADEGKLDYSNSDPFQELCEVLDIENAQLIAAAPELLEALKQSNFALESVFHVTGGKWALPYIEANKAAIAKAEGK